ncbi:MAG: hypothetical protein ABUL62_17395 [Myxococcales bacterium]
MLPWSGVSTKPLELPAQVADPLPIETVRDLLGIVRVLYALQRGKGNHGHARELQSAGQRLRRALELVMHPGDRQAHAAAWQLAEAAIATVARVQSSGRAGDDLSAVVRLASDRVRERSTTRQFKLADRDARRQARIKRG